MRFQQTLLISLTIAISFSAFSQNSHSAPSDKNAVTGYSASAPITASALRPRIFVRADRSKVGKGLTLSQLRRRAKDAAYQEWISFDEKITGWESATATAMQYLLTGEKKYALSTGRYLAATPIPYKEHTSTAAAVYFCAIAFDWIRNGLPDSLVNVITAKLIEGAEHLREGLEQPSVNHNYTIVSLHAVCLTGLAIYGEGKYNTQKALEYISLSDRLLTGENMLLETFKQKGGAWAEGNHYSPFVVCYPFLLTLRAMATATNTDYFDKIIHQYGNFLQPMSRFVIANFRPDFTQERIGDVTERVVPRRTFMRPLLELLASSLHNAELQGQVRSFSKELASYYGTDMVPEAYRWMMLITFDASLPQTPSYKTLPLTMRLGENAYEHMMFRNGWEDSSTMITYLSGDHYTDHQHLDKGHFLIYKKGGLVIDGGGYPAMYNNHWSNYSTRTLAHNNVLLYDSTEATYKSVEGVDIYTDGGQRVIRGAQSHKNWLDYITISKEKGLNTADVLEYDADQPLNRYNYVKSNLSKAYGDKTTWTDRQLLYLPQADFLVVRDRVISSKPLKKYWLLHFEDMPLVDGQLPPAGVTNYPDARIISERRTGKLELKGKTINYTGGLFIKPLLPESRSVSIIGGPGYEYYNRFAEKNFLPEKPFAAIIEPGKWRMETTLLSPSTATVFLHALEITGSDKKEMVPVDYFSSEDKKMNGALFRSAGVHYLTLFSASMDERGDAFQKASLPVKYKVSATAKVHHILTELEPETQVNITVNGQYLGTFTTTLAGVLDFTDPQVGERVIEINTK